MEKDLINRLRRLKGERGNGPFEQELFVFPIEEENLHEALAGLGDGGAVGRGDETAGLIELAEAGHGGVEVGQEGLFPVEEGMREAAFVFAQPLVFLEEELVEPGEGLEGVEEGGKRFGVHGREGPEAGAAAEVWRERILRSNSRLRSRWRSFQAEDSWMARMTGLSRSSGEIRSGGKSTM